MKSDLHDPTIEGLPLRELTPQEQESIDGIKVKTGIKAGAWPLFW